MRRLAAILFLAATLAACAGGSTGGGATIELTAAVIEELKPDFLPADVVTDAGNGKLLAYLNAHAEVVRQEYRGNEAVIRCYLPRHLLRHIEGPGVRVRFLGYDEQHPPLGETA